MQSGVPVGFVHYHSFPLFFHCWCHYLCMCLKPVCRFVLLAKGGNGCTVNCISEILPSISCISIRGAWKGFLEGSDELHHFLLFTSFAGIKAWFSLCLCMIHPFDLYFHFVVHQIMISITICPVKAVYELDGW